MMKMLYATLLSLLIASVSAQSHKVTIASALDGGSKCMEVKGIDGIHSGTAVQIGDCDNSVAQTWSIYYSGSAYAQIRLADPSLNYCLDGLNIRTTNKVEVHECNQSPPQQWNYTYGGYISLVQNRGLCMGVPNSNDGAQVQTLPCNGGLNQKWRFGFLN